MSSINLAIITLCIRTACMNQENQTEQYRYLKQKAVYYTSLKTELIVIHIGNV